MALLDSSEPCPDDVMTELSAIGFVEVVPGNGKSTRANPARLVHRITGESVVLEAELLEKLGFVSPPAEGTWPLIYADDRFRLAFQDKVVAAISEVLSVCIFAGRSGCWCIRSSSGTTSWLCRGSWQKVMRDLTMKAPGQHVFKVWQVPAYSRGAQHRFCLNDCWGFGPTFNSVHPSRGISDAVRNPSLMCKSLGLHGSLILRRTVRGRSTDDSTRFLESHTVSSSGWIFWCRPRASLNIRRNRTCRATPSGTARCSSPFLDMLFGNMRPQTFSSTARRSRRTSKCAASRRSPPASLYALMKAKCTSTRPSRTPDSRSPRSSASSI